MLAGYSACAGADASYVGEARDLQHGGLLYEEHHLLREAEGVPRERLVLYRCPDRRLFARKLVEYGTTTSAPVFALEDGRFGYREGVRRVGEALSAYVARDGATPERQAAIALGPQLVIDAGFDEFVRRHWTDLQSGQTLAVQFLVPSRLDALGFKLKRIGTDTLADASASVFRLSLGGVFGWFAPNIEVSYRDADRRLMRFVGLTNIRADRNDNLSARIDFPPARARRLDATAWQAALAEPLTDCAPGG